MFDREGFAKNLFNIIFNFAAWIFVLVAIIVLYFFFHPELLRQYAMILIPVLIYGCGLIISSWFNNKKKKALEKGQGSAEFNLYINQIDFAKHDLLMFLTPLAIIMAFYWSQGELSGTNIIASAIAFVGLYLAKKIYTKKIIK